MPKLSKGYIHVYTGDGKGKTTAALGLAFRAAGHNLKTIVLHFMKGDIPYGEYEAVKKMSGLITIKQMGRPTFVSKENPDPEDIRMAQEAIQLAAEVCKSGEYDLVILDEVNVAVDFKLISVDEVLEVCRSKPEHVELVLTGRYAKPEIIEVADLVTEMRKIKHYYDDGVSSREGIES